MEIATIEIKLIILKAEVYLRLVNTRWTLNRPLTEPSPESFQ